MTAERLNPEPTFDGLAFLGTNPTGGSANDTRAFWQGKGTGYAWFTATGQLVGQPSQYGFLVNLVAGGDVHQEFWVQNNGAHWHRGGNGSTGAMPSWTANDTDTQTVTGVKGNAEGSYRTGNVNLSRANIGPGNCSSTGSSRSSALTTTGTANIANVNHTSATGRVMVFGSAMMHTSRYTSGIDLYVNGVGGIGSSNTNNTSETRVVVMGWANVPVGSAVGIYLRLHSQESGTTATMPAYEGYTLAVWDV